MLEEDLGRNQEKLSLLASKPSLAGDIFRTLNEFAIVKTFELAHVKTDSRRATPIYQFYKYTWHVHALPIGCEKFLNQQFV